jgi:hypothetical protein
MMGKDSIDEVITSYTKMHHGNPIRTMWGLVDSMKMHYENGNNELAEVYYEAIVSIIKEKLATE